MLYRSGPPGVRNPFRPTGSSVTVQADHDAPVAGDDAPGRSRLAAVRFADGGLLATLDAVSSDRPNRFDEVPFGLVVMDRAGVVIAYNAAEAARTGVAPRTVVGRHLFTEVVPATNTARVAQRFEDAAERSLPLDVTLDEPLPVRGRTGLVRIRLLAAPGSPRQYLTVRSGPAPVDPGRGRLS